MSSGARSGEGPSGARPGASQRRPAALRGRLSRGGAEAEGAAAGRLGELGRETSKSAPGCGQPRWAAAP